MSLMKKTSVIAKCDTRLGIPNNGMSVANAWAKSIVPRTNIRTRSVEEVMILQHTFISAAHNFQNRMSHIDHEKWHETSDDALLFLHKDLCPLTFIT